MLKMLDHLTKRMGPKAMDQPPTRTELYQAVDTLAGAVRGLKDRVEAMEAHGVKYAGVYQKALPYRKGHVVTHSGSMWVALRDADEREAPGASDAWQLAQKHGAAR